MAAERIQVLVRLRPLPTDAAPAPGPYTTPTRARTQAASIVETATATSLVLALPKSTNPPIPSTPGAVCASPMPATPSAPGVTPGRRKGHRRTASSPARFDAAAAACDGAMPASLLAPAQFTFDGVLGEHVGQDAVFAVVEPYVRSVVEDGFNATIMAYGQTGSGKTHTMMGERGGCGAGIIPRTVDAIYAIIGEHKDTRFLIDLCFTELYRESFVDLLDPACEAPPTREHPRKKIDVRLDTDGTTFLTVAGAKLRTQVSSRDHLLQLLDEGMARRTVVSTLMNTSSSRSHAICSIYIEAQTAAGATHQSVLHLVDLAGAERIKNSGVTGVAAKEAVSINRSLSALGDVLAALSKKKRASTNIPYRNSPLTMFLRDSLGGSARTLIIATVRQELAYAHQTKTVLRWATRARKIRNKPIAHTDVADSRIASLEALLVEQDARYKAKIATLEELLATRMETSLDMASESFVAQLDELDAERLRETAEREALEAKLAFVMHSHQSVLGSHADRIESLEAALRAESAKASTLSSNLAASEAQTQAALDDLAAVTARLNLNEAEAAEHAARIVALTRQWGEHSAAAAAKTDKLASRLAKRTKHAAKLKATNASLASALASVTSERDDLKTRLATADDRLADAFAQIARLLDSTNKSQAAKDARIVELESQLARFVSPLGDATNVTCS